MNILLCSHVFAPSVGGIETISELLAAEFSKLGALVTIATETPGNQDGDSYCVVRSPSLLTLFKLGRKADVVFQNNVSLRTLLPLILTNRPIVITHHIWLRRRNGRRGLQDYLKLFLLRFFHNLCVSSALAADLPFPCEIVQNPVELTAFLGYRSTERIRDVVFLGRLVSDKGCDVLIRALAQLKQEGLVAKTTIIGDGPERARLIELAKELNLGTSIEFLGTKTSGRGELLAQHRLLVVPSRWSEPFGLVAVEGIASGCVVVASRTGGLPDAVGPCGMLFERENVAELTEVLRTLLRSPEKLEGYLAFSEQHLQRFKPKTIAERYLRIFSELRH